MLTLLLLACATGGDSSDKTGTDTADTSAQSAKKGEAQVIRQLTLKVWAPGDDGGEGDTIEIVTYLPQIAAKTAAGSKPAGDAPK